jgi:hypothetical protein
LGSASACGTGGTPLKIGSADSFHTTYIVPRLGPALTSAAAFGNSKKPSRRLKPGGPAYQLAWTVATVSVGPKVVPLSVERRCSSEECCAVPRGMPSPSSQNTFTPF